MNKLLAVAVASALVFGSASGFAADTAKQKEELTREDRAEMRNRAERLTAERAQGATQERRAVASMPQAKQELTQAERAELRNRAERLIGERARGVNQEKAPGTRGQGSKTRT